uniref:Uncharacterized protein n=1 Tax=Panagrolaimus sp. ES5 TaxID=591445 RepID=A0AC34FIM8_9BILA
MISVRHTAVVIFQALSYIIVALSSSVVVGITGVVFASIGAGLGEITYLSLASHFHNVRHTAVVIFQALSYIIVALSGSVVVGITGK